MEEKKLIEPLLVKRILTLNWFKRVHYVNDGKAPPNSEFFFFPAPKGDSQKRKKVEKIITRQPAGQGNRIFDLKRLSIIHFTIINGPKRVVYAMSMGIFFKSS